MSYTKPLSILVATDLRDGALEFAVALAQATKGSLNVLHAHEVSFPRSDRGRDIVAIQQEAREKRVALTELLERIIPAAITLSSSRVREGVPAELILNEAESLDADIIVLGTHRRRPVADRLIGSTAERVLREASVPCILANGQLGAPLRRVLVPSDLLGTSTRALEEALLWAQRLAEGEESVVEVAHVVTPGAPNGDSWAATDAELTLRKAAASVVDGLSSDIPTSISILSGSDPTLELLDYARSSDAQLIVMGTNSDSVLVRALIGSVSSSMIRRSDLPVMLVPSKAKRAGVTEDRSDRQLMEPLLRA